MLESSAQLALLIHRFKIKARDGGRRGAKKLEKKSRQSEAEGSGRSGPFQNDRQVEDPIFRGEMAAAQGRS